MRKGLVAKAESILAKRIYEGFFYGRMSWSSREEEKNKGGSYEPPSISGLLERQAAAQLE